MESMRLSAVTLLVSDMPRALRFYEVLGAEVVYGGAESAFTSIRLGGDSIHDGSYLNLSLESAADGPKPAGSWGRWILHVADVDAVYRAFTGAGFTPEMPPSDAPWGERYFHVRDPDGHELSIARPRD